MNNNISSDHDWDPYLCDDLTNNIKYCHYTQVNPDDHIPNCKKCRQMYNCTWKFSMSRSRCSCGNFKFIWSVDNLYESDILNAFDISFSQNDPRRYLNRSKNNICLGNLVDA
jgi:hypothetical protein